MEKTRKLSGKGFLGFLCPKCENPLEYFSNLYDNTELIAEIWRCLVCKAKFVQKYHAKGWREI